MHELCSSRFAAAVLLTSCNSTIASNSRTLKCSLDTILTARICPVSWSRWRHTSPKAPEPSFSSVFQVAVFVITGWDAGLGGVWTTVVPLSEKTECSLYRMSVALAKAMIFGCGELTVGGRDAGF